MQSNQPTLADTWKTRAKTRAYCCWNSDMARQPEPSRHAQFGVRQGR